MRSGSFAWRRERVSLGALSHGRSFLPSVIFLLALAACARPDKEAAKAIRAYERALVSAYRTGDASGMPSVATAREAQRVKVLVDLKTASGLVLESTLERLEVTRAEARKGKATVETRELWRYLDRHLRPGEGPGPTFVAEMAMRYDLVREDGRFKVNEVTTLENRFIEGRPGKPEGADLGAAHRAR